MTAQAIKSERSLKSGVMKPKLTFVTRAAFFTPLILLIACNILVAPTDQPDTPVVQLPSEILTATSLPSATHTPSPTPAFQPSITPIHTPLPSLTATILPAEIFAFGPTPQGGQSGGISGIFVYEYLSPSDDTCPKTSDVLRFYSDGLVLSVPICMSGSVLERWSDISKWFNRDSEVDISRGQYYLLGEHIWFSTTTNNNPYGPVSINDYSGTYMGSILILDSYSHFNGHKSAGYEYVQVNVDQ